MRLVFEYIFNGEFRNLIKCPDSASPGIRRFTPSPIIAELMVAQAYQKSHKYVIAKEPIKGEPYIIATGVAHAPWDWCGPDSQGLGFDKNQPLKKTLFAHLNKKYLKALRKGMAYLLIDQSHEGYQTEWLWAWFHNNCRSYGINPRQIIYVTGNLDSRDQYEEWTKQHPPENKILVVPYPHFESVIANILISNIEKYPSLNQQLEYKQTNLESIKTYSALQKRARPHRIWFFKHLSDANLLEDGINSMNAFKMGDGYFEGKAMSEDEYNSIIHKLPMLPPNTGKKGLKVFANQDCGHYLTKFNDEIMLDTWLTVVSEASFGESEHECFLSEKTFKPIACNHPFIIAGNRLSLHRLRELGYKTFSPYIDESYDTLSAWPRMSAITKEISRINSMSAKDKLTWFNNIKHILEHNYEHLKSRSSKNSSIYLKVIEDHVTKRIV